jgi:hypothetical protein
MVYRHSACGDMRDSSLILAAFPCKTRAMGVRKSLIHKDPLSEIWATNQGVVGSITASRTSNIKGLDRKL